MSSRNSIICISKGINIDKNYKHTLALTSNNIKNLCASGKHKLYYGNDYSFLRPEGRIKVQVSYSQLFEANYCYITNQGKTQFFFIDEIIYIADNTTELKVTEDVVTTYKDYGFNKVFCERQHPQTDELYANTVSESITPSNYKVGSYQSAYVSPTEFKALFSEAWEGGDQFGPVPSVEVGILANNQINTLHIVGGSLTASNLQGFVNYYHNYVKNGKASDLVSLYTRPKPNTKGTMSLPQPTNFGGYVPKNNKLFNYPFCVVHLTNCNGTTVDFKPELLTSRDFKYMVADNGKAQAFCYPANYMGRSDNTDYGVIIDNYPTIPMAVDSYTEWLGQAANGITEGLIGSAVTAGLSVALAPVTGGMSLMGLAGSAMGTISQATEALTHIDNTPDSVRGLASGNILAQALNNFRFRVESHLISREQAETIDDYFTRFGYAQNRLMQVRHINPRFHCHYVKTAPGENVMKAVPHAKASIINNAFASGITFWDDNDEVGNYNPK